MGEGVGVSVGFSVGSFVGVCVSAAVGVSVGEGVGRGVSVGVGVGLDVGVSVGVPGELGNDSHPASETRPLMARAWRKRRRVERRTITGLDRCSAINKAGMAQIVSWWFGFGEPYEVEIAVQLCDESAVLRHAGLRAGVPFFETTLNRLFPHPCSDHQSTFVLRITFTLKAGDMNDCLLGGVLSRGPFTRSL